MEYVPKKVSKDMSMIRGMRCLNSRSMPILENVMRQCKYENDVPTVKEKLQPYLLKASRYTGVPVQVIEVIQKLQAWKCPKQSLSLQLNIREILLRLYTDKKSPTCKIVYEILKLKKINVPLFTEFRNQMVHSGYETVEVVNGRQMIIENPKLTFERYLYLKKITNARNMSKKINYMSVRIYDRVNKCMVPLTSAYLNQLTPTSHCLMLYHVISKDGCKNVFFSYNFERNNIIKWVSHILVPILKKSGEQSSVIVIENNPLFNSAKEHISRYDSKNNMIKWLKIHNLPCNRSMHKAELYELIDKCSVKLNNVNSLENVLKSFGHSVIHLPEQIYELTPTELLWRDINDKLKSINVCENIDMLVKHCIIDILDSTTKWQTYDQEIQHTEQIFLTLETDLEDCVDKYELNLDSIISEGDKNLQHITFV